MRLLIQISVSGYKIFDTATFPHHTENGSYALMSDINETQKGTPNYRTHITGLDSHGVPSSVLSLFSTSGIDYVLQDVKQEGDNNRVFFVSQNGITKDFLGRKCEVSFILISENDEDIAFINKFASIVLTKQDSCVLINMQRILGIVPLGEQLVLEYNAKLFHSVVDYVNEYEVAPCGSIMHKLANENMQVLVVPNAVTFKEKINDISTSFNHEPYCILESSNIPLEKNYLSDDLVCFKILDNSFIQSSSKEQYSHQDILEEILNTGKKFIKNLTSKNV